MGQVKWAISSEAFEKPGYPKITDALERSGTEFFNAKFNITDRTYEKIPYKISECVVLYGPIKFVKMNMGCIPGGFGFKDVMNTSYYMSLYPRDLFFNDRAIYLPFGMIQSSSALLKNMFGENIFIRPDSGFKSFTGFTTTIKNLPHEISTRKQISNVGDQEMCLISSAKDIEGEFRFVIADGEVITGSQYRWDNVLDIRIDVRHDCWTFAEKIAKLNYDPFTKYDLDRVYTVDVFLAPFRGPTIGEFNSFASAGLYNCDMDKVVEAVNRVAESKYEGYYR